VSSFEIITRSLEHLVFDLFNSDVDVTGPYISEFISRVFEFQYLAIDSSLLYENNERVDGVGQLISVADMTRRSIFLARALALRALSLKLLLEARHDLLHLDNLALTVAPRTVVNVVWVISAATSAVRADGLLVVS
jgi:hypothetical protein